MAATRRGRSRPPSPTPEIAAVLGRRGPGPAAGQAAARRAASAPLSARRSARSAAATARSGRRPSGRGTIYSYSVMRRAPVPYAIAYVTLEEGVTMMTNIVDCDFDALRIGQPVRVVFKPTDGGPPVPMFTPA